MTETEKTDVYLLLVKDGKMSNPPYKIQHGVIMYPVWESSEQDLKKKFGKSGVEETIRALHDFIQMDGFTEMTGAIQPGDYINLDSLTVGGTAANNNLKLIVVGINSFHSQGEYNNDAAKAVNDGVDHVVFQFEGVPITDIKMNNDNSATNAGGYAASDMRKYLTPVTDATGSGTFLAGLVAAGVPEDLMWAPLRYVSKKGTEAGTVKDLLWLPTEWEMTGSNEYSESSYEKAANQARLEYYISNPTKKDSEYWLGSPGTGTDTFVYVSGEDGGLSIGTASQGKGVAPAFCIY
jgi:hypothetical protein